jgi:hypothetical protein
MKTYTVEQFKKYLLSQDSMGDIMYNLSEKNIDKANEPKIEVGEKYTLKSYLDIETTPEREFNSFSLRPGEDITVVEYDGDSDGVIITIFDNDEEKWVCIADDLLNAIK